MVTVVVIIEKDALHMALGSIVSSFFPVTVASQAQCLHKVTVPECRKF